MTPRDSSADGASPRERIREAAMELFAERGRRGPTLKAVAERADVSPGLVQHHFKTKQRMLAEVQGWVLERLADLGADLRPGEANLGLDAARFDEFLVANPVVAAYLRRRLLDAADDETADWFTVAVEQRHNPTDGGTPADDAADVIASMSVLIDVAPVLLGPLLTHALDCDQAELARRWRRVETDVLGLPHPGPG
jgi:AcrR family transcriptional regulator